MRWSTISSRVRELVSEYYEPLYRYAYRLTGRGDQADDLTQETFCRAQAQWRQLRDPQNPKPWLFAILRNCFLRDRRDQRVARQLPFDPSLDFPQPTPDAAPLDLDPGQLQALLDGLPEAFRSPLILFYFEDFTYREIADQMGVPLGTVMSRLARAKAHLRQRLLAAPISGGRDEL